MCLRFLETCLNALIVLSYKIEGSMAGLSICPHNRSRKSIPLLEHPAPPAKASVHPVPSVPEEARTVKMRRLGIRNVDHLGCRRLIASGNACAGRRFGMSW